MSDGVQVAVDVGGTFTDVVAHSISDGRTTIAKTLSTPEAPSVGVLEGIQIALRESGHGLKDVASLRHGTTIATNAVLERKIAKTALIVTKGFKDILYIGRQARPSLYDLGARHPAPLAPRHLTFELDERVGWSGEVEKPIARDEVNEIARRLNSEGVESAAICLIHAYVNPTHEIEIRDALARLLPDLPVCLSSEICPEIGEYERASTTVVNASVMPLVVRYVSGLKREIQSFRGGCQIYIMQSNGGAMGPEVAAKKSVHTMYSGPAGGLIGAQYFARRAGLENSVTLDVGGTSADVGVIVGQRLEEARDGFIGGLPIRVPLLEIHSVGAGGGSVAWIDSGGALRVGPHSAGADPGPICYGRGGSGPTLTDAHVILGNIGAEATLGGCVALDAEAAAEGILEQIATPLNLPLANSASGILDVANAIMLRAIRVLTVQRGLDPKDFALIALGGAGPLHAVALARSLGIGTVLVPPAAGVLSALGMLTTAIKHDFVRTRIALATDLTADGLREDFTSIENEALRVMEREGFRPDDVAIERWIEMRYRGQGFELAIRPVNDRLLNSPALALGKAFHDAHEHRYGFAMREESVELVNIGVTARGGLSEFQYSRPGQAAIDVKAAQVDERSVRFEAGDKVARVFARDRLPCEANVQGPAIIEGEDSTTLIPVGATCRTDRTGALLVTVNDKET